MVNKINFGFGEYERIEKNKEQDSLFLMRVTFLNRLNNLVPRVSDELAGELLELYQQIPLFSFEADKKRSRKNRQKYRLSWYNTCRPNWETIENAWKSSVSKEEFEIEFDNYYAEADEHGYSLLPIFKMPRHKDPKITLFVQKFFEWSERNHLDKMWCRKHAFETLDLWSAKEGFRDKRVWQLLPSLIQFGGAPITVMNCAPPDFATKMSFDLEESLGKKLWLYPTVGFLGDFEKVFNNIKDEIEIWKQQVLDSLVNREIEAKQSKFEKTPVKMDYKHFDWLIYDLFEIKTSREMAGLSNEIKDKRGGWENDSTKKVRKAISELSKLIDLPLNPKNHRAGRPQKQ